MNKRIIEIDLMKSVAILFIIVTHLSAYLNQLDFIRIFQPYFVYLGLGTFVFVSGYLLYYAYPNINLRHDITKYYFKRFLRIYPLYWTALGIFVIIFGISTRYLGNGGIDMDMFNLIVHFFGLQILFAPMYITPMPTLWYIGLIVLYYGIYPFLISCSKNTRTICINSLFVIAIAAVIHIVFNIIEIRFFQYFFLFILGIIAGNRKLIENSQYSNYLFMSPLLLVCALVICSKMELQKNGLTYLQMININILMTSFVFTLFLFFKQFAYSFSPTEKHIYSTIAYASYCIYLFHRPILSIIAKIVNFFFTPVVADLIVILCLPLLVIISYNIQYIESKLIKKVDLSKP